MPRMPLLVPISALVLSAVFAALPPTVARAQVAPIDTGRSESSYSRNTFPIYIRSHTPEQVGREVEIERRYREVVNARIPDKKASNDPWKSIRQAPARPAAAAAYDRHRVQ